MREATGGHVTPGRDSSAAHAAAAADTDKPLESTLTDWIDSSHELADLLAHGRGPVGVDTEFVRTDTYFPRLALVQVSTGSRIALADPLAIDDLSALDARLADPGDVTIMHGAGEDVGVLATRLPHPVGRLFDTQLAAAFAGLGHGIGYQALVRTVCGVELPKGETRSDWLRRPLTPQQLEYAAQDVAHLAQLHDDLGRRIDARGQRTWFDADCARLVARATRPEPDPEPQRALRAAADWPLEQQARLRRILLWREATARAIDRPRPWLVDDAHALDLARDPPATAEALRERTRGQRSLRAPQRDSLFTELSRPFAAEDLRFAPIPRGLERRDQPVLAAMKAAVAVRAAELDLPPGLLCARRSLEDLLTTRDWPDALSGWRREILYDSLTALLPDSGAEAR